MIAKPQTFEYKRLSGELLRRKVDSGRRCVSGDTRAGIRKEAAGGLFDFPISPSLSLPA